MASTYVIDDKVGHTSTLLYFLVVASNLLSLLPLLRLLHPFKVRKAALESHKAVVLWCTHHCIKSVIAVTPLLMRQEVSTDCLTPNILQTYILVGMMSVHCCHTIKSKAANFCEQYPLVETTSKCFPSYFNDSPKNSKHCCPQSSCLLCLWLRKNDKMCSTLGVTSKSIRSMYIRMYVFLLCWHKCTYVCWSCLIVLQVLHVDMKVLTTYQSPHLHHPTAPAAGTSAPPSWSTGASLTCGSMSTSPPTTPWGSTSAGRDWQGSAPASKPGGGGGGCKAVFVLKSVCDQTYVMYVRHMCECAYMYVRM